MKRKRKNTSRGPEGGTYSPVLGKDRKNYRKKYPKESQKRLEKERKEGRKRSSKTKDLSKVQTAFLQG